MQYGLFCLDDTHLTGVPEIKINGSDAMYAFPNPAKEEVKIRLKDQRGQFVKLEMVDALGKTIKQWNDVISSTGDVKFSLTQIVAGIYFVKASTKENVFVCKVHVVK